ncbi:MAG TPA: AAA family ATPase [Actinomycetales bacterium]|nr:AAA family ATPase [Actinomycetales bacterium]
MTALQDAYTDAMGWEPPGVVTLANVAPERVQWLWPGRLPLGKLVVVDGDPGVAKSTVALDIGARVSAGTDWPDGAPGGDPAGVLLLSAEDGLADTLAPRLAAAGADPSNVHALVEVEVAGEDEQPRYVPPSLPRDIDLIERVIRRHGVRLVVVDVLMAYLNGKVDSHRDQGVRSVLHLLSAMAERTGCCVLLIRHLNKSAGGSALYRGGGSIGIIGAARAAYLVARDPEDEDRRIVAVTKLNIAVEPPALAFRLVDDPLNFCARVQWEDAPTNHTAAELLRGPGDDEERSERDEAVEWLVDYLTGQNGEASASDCIRAAGHYGITKTTLHRARKRAGIGTVKSGLRGGWLWQLDPGRFHEGAEDVSPHGRESSQPSVEPSPVDPEVDDAAEGPPDECSECSAPLLLKVAGRTVCERCRIAGRAAS